MLTLVVGVGIIFSRRPDAFTNPQFWAEDGRYWFDDAYNGGGLANVLHQHSGYLEVFNRVVATVAIHLPLAWAPAIFNLAGLGCQLAPALILVSTRFSNVIASLPLRLLAAGFYFALPNTYEVDINLTNSQWHLALAAALLLVSLPARNRFHYVFDSLLVGFSALTGPFALVFVPLAAVILYRRRAPQSAVMFVVCVAGACAQLVTLVNIPRGTPQFLGAGLHALVRILGGQIVIGTVAGQNGFASILRDTTSTVPEVLACLAGGAVCVAVVVRGTAEQRLLLGFAVALLTASLLRPAAGSSGSAWAELGTPGAGGRYYLIPMALGVILVVALAERVKRPARSTLAAGLVIMCVVGIPRDWRYPQYVNLHFGRYVAAFRDVPTGHTFAIPTNPPGWGLILTKR